jgi:hypothetical protein
MLHTKIWPTFSRGPMILHAVFFFFSTRAVVTAAVSFCLDPLSAAVTEALEVGMAF